ncbi:MAG TPA: gas vesicle protein [Microscillaceae bacterium]|jgi:gas vesicle protein|nr:gas vesicle protein [Microscillaceae bacterium]
MNKLGNFLSAFVAGTLVGGAIGLLYAPTEGRNTRKKLTYRLSKYKVLLQEAVQDLLQGKDELLDNEARNEGEKRITETREKAEKLMGDVEQLIGQLKKGKPRKS